MNKLTENRSAAFEEALRLWRAKKEIYLVRALKSIGDTKKRPAVVVSINILKNALQGQYKPWQYIFS